VKLHVVDSASYMAALDPATRFKTDAAFMAGLREEGQARAGEWLLSRRQSGPTPRDFRSMAGSAELLLKAPR
jgi:hypothetical protein